MSSQDNMFPCLEKHMPQISNLLENSYNYKYKIASYFNLSLSNPFQCSLKMFLEIFVSYEYTSFSFTSPYLSTTNSLFLNCTIQP